MGMHLGLKLLLLLLWIFLAYLCGLLLFTKGFLLKRVVVSNHSWCLDNDENHEYLYDTPSTKRCLPHVLPQFNKTVIVIVDALRFDFLEYTVLGNNSKLHYQNNFLKFQKILNNTNNAKLYRFVADPPTTTMQRLKGLTTGSLPTFVDAGSNFASYEITEDNIIHQLHSYGKKIIFLGDDTWTSLFPRNFYRSFPFPSFDVKDLDAVDDGVIKHLMPEVNKHDWDVIIAHLLGVDHCGHKFGPNHPEMARKLLQMDDVLSALMDNVENDTILFVFGDHGMTSSGDHGGDSKDEVHAGLIIFSKTQLFANQKVNSPPFKEVSQIDLVPTLSLLMGIPIPFGNLGMIIEDVFELNRNNTYSDSLKTFKSYLNTITALRANARQVLTYIKEYSSVSEDLSHGKIIELEELFKEAERKLNVCISVITDNRRVELLSSSEINKFIVLINESRHLYKQFLGDVSETCRNIWAKFDTLSIIFGLSIIVPFPLIIILLLLLSFGSDYLWPYDSIISYADVAGILISFVSLFVALTGKPNPEMSICLLMILQIINLLLLFRNAVVRNIFATIHVNVIKVKEMFGDISKCSCNVVGLALNLCLICYLLSMFSNSFVVNEDSVVLFFIQTCLCLQCVIHFKDVLLSFASTSEKKTEKKSERPGNKVKPKPKPKKPLAEGASLRLVVTIVALICLRMTAYFRNCREEQATCQSSIFMDLFSSLASRPDDYFTQMRLTLAFAGLAGICSFVYLSCNKNGNLAGVQVVTICVKLIFPLMCGSMFISWVLQMPLTGNFMKIVDFIWLQQVLFPRFVYIGFITTMILLLWNPLGLCIIFRDKETLESVQATKNTDSEIIQQVFREVRDGLCKRNQSSKSSRNDDESNEKPPLVFGLGNVYSTAYIVITICTALLLITILGDGICFAVFLLMISGYIICKYGRRSEEMSKQGVQFSTIIMWSFLASSGFFSTGHQATIPSIRFDAAFVGFQGGTKAIIIPGLLIFLNTFASHVIFAVALPLLSIFTSGVSSYNNSNQTDRIKSQTAPNETGEFFIRENPMPTRVNLFKTMVLYLAVRMLKVSTTAAVAALHRRHLMVWKIFAPRFVFEAASLLCSFPVMVFSFLFFLRVDYCLRKWTTNLEEYIELKYS